MTTTQPTPTTGAPAPLPHHVERRKRGLWVGLPSRRDPRLPFALLLFTYAATGTLIFGFNRTPEQMFAIIASGCVLDMVLHWFLRGKQLLFPMSAFITCCSLTLLLNFSHDIFITLVPVFIAIAGKYVITLRGRHVYNPSLLAIVVCLLFAQGLITAAPAYQWGDWWYTVPFMLAAALLMFIMKVDRLRLVGSFLFFYVIALAIRAVVMRHHLPPEVLFVGSLTTPPFFLFTFYMITDPATSPPDHRTQIWIGFWLALVDTLFHFRWSVFTVFYAAFTVASVRYALGWWQEIRKDGVRVRMRTAMSRQWWKAFAIVGSMAVIGGTAYATVIRPHVVLDDAGFTVERLDAAETGLEFEYDDSVLKMVDDRAQHVAKWLLSVGAAGAASDLDGDGLQDLVLTNPIAVAGDRMAVMRNTGDMRFERQDVPALADLEGGDPAEHGLAGGPLLIDYDQDGDRDLFVMVAFGETRLLRNDSTDGKIAFTDVTEEAGAGVYSVGVTANVLDYDRDGVLDIYLANILPTKLEEYDKPRPRFNLFDLPEAEDKDDRRMLKFMHDSWDDARNGGENVVLHGRRDGTFERIRGSELGMPETHYSISVATGDVNGDGWTDIYSASDFGRDDLYINEGGERFRRVQGRFFGDIGKDTYKGMNATLSDLDRNGWLDAYVSNVHHQLQAEGSLLYMNQGVGDGTSEHNAPGSAKQWPAPKLDDQATGRNILNEHRFGWGADAVDLDNDGWLDVVQANGMVGVKLDRDPDIKGDCPDYWYVNAKLMQSGPEIHTYADKWGDLRGRCIFADEAVRAYKNRGADAKPQFVDVAELTGFDVKTEGRGVVFADFDNDGWSDAVVTAQHEQPYAFRTSPTKSARDHEYVDLQLDGGARPDDESSDTACNRDAWGSQIWVDMPGGGRQLFEQQAVNGFEAQRDSRVHVGLGKVRSGPIDVTVRWCGHERERFQVEPGGTRTVRRGAGTAVKDES